MGLVGDHTGVGVFAGAMVGLMEVSFFDFEALWGSAPSSLGIRAFLDGVALLLVFME